MTRKTTKDDERRRKTTTRRESVGDVATSPKNRDETKESTSDAFEDSNGQSRLIASEANLG
jgi:hypothetical protein